MELPASLYAELIDRFSIERARLLGVFLVAVNETLEEPLRVEVPESPRWLQACAAETNRIIDNSLDCLYIQDK